MQMKIIVKFKKCVADIADGSCEFSVSAVEYIYTLWFQ